MKKTIQNSLLLTLTALIWGVAFVAQSAGGDAVGPYTFNCLRSVIGFIVLIPVTFMLDRRYGTKTAWTDKKLLLGGTICGIILCIASNLQQMGISCGSSVGKAGFLTACYIIFVPVFGLFLNKKCAANIWIGTALTVIGLYLLCIDEEFKLALSDLLLILCAIVFSAHILVIDHFGSAVDSVKMSCIQFLICAILTAAPMCLVDLKSDFDTWRTALFIPQSWIPILYAGIFSCGVAYTLQIVAQPKLHPTVASLILSLESVFSVLAGWVILREQLSVKEISGCFLIFIAILLAQIPGKD